MLKAIITINMAYPLTALTILFLVSILVPGYELFYTSNIIVLTALAPCTSFFLFNPKLNPSFYTTEIFIIWWCTLSIVLFALSLLVYRKRCSHSNIITSSRKYIFCYSKSFIVSILGLFFGAWLLAVTSNHLLFFVGAFISSLVLYIAVDVIKSRKLNGLDLKHYSISIIVILVTYTVINFGVFGYDKRVPKSDNIQSVEISDYNSTFVDTEKKYDSIITDGKKLDLKPSLKNISSIESAVDFHEKIINGISRETPYLQKRKNDQTILLNYKLKNGTDMKRVYYKEELDSASLSAYFDIIDSEEYKKQSNILFNIDAKDVKSINIKYFSDSLTVKEVELGQELHTDIKQDILNSVKFDILQDNIQKQTKWKTLSNSTSYIFITFRSYESEYDNPDMKNILFFDRGHIIPSYYEKTINSLNKENLL